MTDRTKRYRLLKDYKTPKGTCYEGVTHTARDWQLEWFPYLQYADFDIKDDWFAVEVLPVSEPVPYKIEVMNFVGRKKYTDERCTDTIYEFNSTRQIPLDRFPAIKQAIESALNDTVVEDRFDGKRASFYAMDEVGQWAAADKELTKEKIDELMKEFHNQPLQFYSPPKRYSQSEVDAIRADTWYAARKITDKVVGEIDFKDGDRCPFYEKYFNSINDYLSSLNLNSNDTGKEDNETKSANWRSENLSKQSAPEPSALPNKEWKEWKIVDIMDDNGQIISNPSTDIIHMVLKHRGERIHSVRRESDKEIFTIGDKISWGCTGVYETTLTTFEIKNNRLKFYYDKLPENSNPCDFLDAINLYKLPTPTQPVLFTTEDGVEIKDRVTDYYAVRDFKRSGRCNGMAWYHPETGEKYFSTPEAAEQYILENKKLFSLQEIKQYVGIYSSDFCLEKFELSAKLKLNK